MMKIKDNQTRTYDGEGYKKRAACLCFKNDREEEVRVETVETVSGGGGREREPAAIAAAARCLDPGGAHSPTLLPPGRPLVPLLLTPPQSWRLY